jgi:hypothetical protein
MRRMRWSRLRRLSVALVGSPRPDRPMSSDLTDHVERLDDLVRGPDEVCHVWRKHVAMTLCGIPRIELAPKHRHSRDYTGGTTCTCGRRICATCHERAQAILGWSGP